MEYTGTRYRRKATGAGCGQYRREYRRRKRPWEQSRLSPLSANRSWFIVRNPTLVAPGLSAETPCPRTDRIPQNTGGQPRPCIERLPPFPQSKLSRASEPKAQDLRPKTQDLPHAPRLQHTFAHEGTFPAGPAGKSRHLSLRTDGLQAQPHRTHGRARDLRRRQAIPGLLGLRRHAGREHHRRRRQADRRVAAAAACRWPNWPPR